jgi:hypothetical protein
LRMISAQTIRVCREKEASLCADAALAGPNHALEHDRFMLKRIRR